MSDRLLNRRRFGGWLIAALAACAALSAAASASAAEFSYPSWWGHPSTSSSTSPDRHRSEQQKRSTGGKPAGCGSYDELVIPGAPSPSPSRSGLHGPKPGG